MEEGGWGGGGRVVVCDLIKRVCVVTVVHVPGGILQRGPDVREAAQAGRVMHDVRSVRQQLRVLHGAGRALRL